jgi:RNA polymerase sigma factor (sigma-70 family)
MGHEPTVFIVDDDSAMRDSLRLLCESVGLNAREFSSARQFLDEHDMEASGCLILDVRMPGGSGLVLLERLREMGNNVPVLVLTGYADVPMAVRAMKQVNVEFLEKTVGQQELLDCIQQAIARDAQNHDAQAKVRAFRERLTSLTEREREVMDFVVDGLSSKQIAKKLGISFKTIEAHRARIMKKMGMPSVPHLIRCCLEMQQASGNRAWA